MSQPDPIPEFESLPAPPLLSRDAEGPVFAEPWQAQAFALAVKLSEQGHFTWKEWAAALADELKTHFLFRSLCNRLLKRILNRFQISGIWLQAHFEIIEDRLLVGFGCGDFLELHVAQHDFVAPDRCQALDHVAHCPLSIFVGAIAGE